MNQALKDAVEKVAPATVPADQIIVIKANGHREAFEVAKLRESLLRSGASAEVAEEVVSRLLPELHNDITTDEIYGRAFAILKNLERASARKYSLRRAVMELGPSGFPFEEFVAAIMQTKGYETKIGETVLGGCVSHEVDVVAWNAKKLIMIEAKFHNELGTKSDLKVALYIKARFDDIKDNVFNYGGEDRKVTDCWLITNTKFTSTAIHYAKCKDMALIGWNYPEEGSLKDLIEEAGLHPITCLTSLSQAEKKVLLDAKVVLCSTLKRNPSILKELLGKRFDSAPVISEISEL